MSQESTTLGSFIRNLDPDIRILADDTREGWLTSAWLEEKATAWRDQFAGPKRLVFHYIRNTAEHVAAFIGLLSAGHAVALLDPKLSLEKQHELENIYSPALTVNTQRSATGHIEGIALREDARHSLPLHPSVAVLLSTSGSTGSPKFVRLSLENLLSNAEAIGEVLDIRGNEVGLGHLPLHYSYGLSVLTSHLLRAAPVLLTERGFMDQEFWPRLKQMGVSHFPGVPFHYQTLRRLGFERIDLSTVRVMTQAGGMLDLVTRNKVHSFMDQRSGRFHVMYGQTEASPRITTLSHEDFPSYSETVGTALPGGKIEIIDASGSELPIGGEGEVQYRGPNVMLGYAEKPEDLSLGDVQLGLLRTGDIGRLDAYGRLTLTGRSNRFAKIAGLRISLDEVERAAATVAGETATVQKDEHIFIYCCHSQEEEFIKRAVIDTMLVKFTIPKISFKVVFVDSIPRTERGKTDYTSLGRLT